VQVRQKKCIPVVRVSAQGWATRAEFLSLSHNSRLILGKPFSTDLLIDNIAVYYGLIYGN